MRGNDSAPSPEPGAASRPDERRSAAATQPAPRAPSRVAVIGAGTIGLSWLRLFASHGSHVVVFDPRPDLAEAVNATVASAGVSPDAVDLAASAAAAADGAELVQENGPERPEQKAALFAELAETAAPEALLLSSSSAILPTRIAADLPDEAAARTLIGHPFNPPHIMPLVEVVPGERTAQDSVERALRIYRAYGREPVALARETRGFVGNRLQNAILREAAHLVQTGVVDVEGLDAVVTGSLGLRWAAVGPLEGMHLGGGEQGLRGFMEHIGPSFAAIDLHEPDMSREGMAGVVEQAENAYGLPPRAESARERDRLQEEILRMRSQSPRSQTAARKK